MKEQELIDWFNNYYDNCYYVKHNDFPESLFMFYDINYARQLKLAKLEGIDYVEKTEVTGVCLFEQDWKNNWLRCNFDLIWGYLCDNYSYNYDNNMIFLIERLEEHSMILNPNPSVWLNINQLLEHSKLNIITRFTK